MGSPLEAYLGMKWECEASVHRLVHVVISEVA